MAATQFLPRASLVLGLAPQKFPPHAVKTPNVVPKKAFLLYHQKPVSLLFIVYTCTHHSPHRAARLVLTLAAVPSDFNSNSPYSKSPAASSQPAQPLHPIRPTLYNVGVEGSISVPVWRAGSDLAHHHPFERFSTANVFFSPLASPILSFQLEISQWITSLNAEPATHVSLFPASSPSSPPPLSGFLCPLRQNALQSLVCWCARTWKRNRRGAHTAKLGLPHDMAHVE